MYEAHWGLKQRPFENNTAGDFYFRSETHRAAALKVRYAIDGRLGAALLCGEVGVGKTFLSHMVAAKAADDGILSLHLTYPRLTPNELIGWVYAELRGHGPIDTIPGTFDGTLRALEARLKQLTKEGQRPVLFVDDAHLVNDPELLQAWHLLLNFQQQEDIDFTLVLVGEPSLLPQIRRCRPLAERIGVTALVRPLDQAETAEYIQHRLETAGRTEDDDLPLVFSDDAIMTIFERSGGIPRRINRLCDLALLVGYAERLTTLTGTEIEGVAQELTLGIAA
ncbi:ExeA family protein [Thalassoroseus pseudoceratinae]|uniref:ExeA family protein n=1 Tax=Thalassoroseus pseudoceratinae TaxID=2713176 RepID=UPI00141E8250|nr:AAA family ATPase [Thalassoroseus pseudoceratinae]